MSNPYINIIEKGQHVGDIKNLKVTPILMKTKSKQTVQNIGYIKGFWSQDLESHALSSNQMQASLFVWRVKGDDSRYLWGKALNNIVINLDNTFKKSKLASDFKKEFVSLKKISHKLAKLAQYSRIYATVIANILKNRKELHYVFLNLVSGSGAKLFSAILKFFKN